MACTMGRLLPALFLATLASSAYADAPVKVAIIPGIAVNLDTARVDALSQDLAESLNAELEVQAIGGLEVRRQLPPEGIAPDCVTTPACTADVARRTGATQLLFVVMVDSGASGSVQIDTTWVEPATGRTASRPAIDLTSPQEARAKFSSAAHTLLPDAPVRTKETAPTGGGLTVSHAAMTGGVPRHFSTTAKITAGVGTAGLVVGVTFGLITRSKYNSCDSNPVTCTDSKHSTIRNYALLADSGFVIAIAGAVTTAVLWASSAEEPHLLVAPTSDGSGAALTALGRF
jgi:hypothetical protein